LLPRIRSPYPCLQGSDPIAELEFASDKLSSEGAPNGVSIRALIEPIWTSLRIDGVSVTPARTLTVC
jgi:hypothetical protein